MNLDDAHPFIDANRDELIRAQVRMAEITRNRIFVKSLTIHFYRADGIRVESILLSSIPEGTFRWHGPLNDMKCSVSDGAVEVVVVDGDNIGCFPKAVIKSVLGKHCWFTVLPVTQGDVAVLCSSWWKTVPQDLWQEHERLKSRISKLLIETR